MKLHDIIFILFFSLFIRYAYATPSELSKTSLSGKVTEEQTGEPIAGVIIYLPDLKVGAITDLVGHYQIDNLPQTTVLIQVSFVSYKTILENVDLRILSEKNFSLEYIATEVNEVVITGLSRAVEQKRTPAPISIVSKTSLLQNSSTNIIDAIAMQPGISQVTTGAGIAKPVIRGLGYNRVLVVKDGLRQEGQQWGDEHGIEIDENSVDRIEILKGPASLSYGSDAMAGVINLLSAPTLPVGTIKGNISAAYQSNNGLMGNSINLAGHMKAIIWDLRYSSQMAHAYKNTKDGYVLNSGFREQAFNGLIGMNRSWGYSHLIISAFHLVPGIIEGTRDSISGKFEKPVALNDSIESTVIAGMNDYKNYHPGIPSQNIHHYKIVWQGSIMLGKGNIKSILGFQQNRRQEYADILNPAQYGLFFLLNTFNYDINYNLPEWNKFSLSVGMNGMKQTSENRGIEFLVPAYSLLDAGIYAILKKQAGKLDISGGFRYDARIQHGYDLFLDTSGKPLPAFIPGAAERFQKFNLKFPGISGSLGASYQLSKAVFTKLNLSRGFRAPNISELGSNGIHEGTSRYELGNSKLVPETSVQLDYVLGLNVEHISAEADIFYNQVDHYIFARKLLNNSESDSLTDGYTTFKFFSGDARLYGGEIRLDMHPHPLDWIHFENSFSYVRGEQPGNPDSTRYLPLIPAPKFLSEIRIDIKNAGKNLTSAYFKISLEKYFRQNEFYAAFNSETGTPGYTLLNIGAGTEIRIKGKMISSLYCNVNNLLDLVYQSHLSRLKYAPLNNATGETGIYNMGRNITFKLIVPLEIRQ
jgi:iron complex outermembrane recepter protein